jgi:hypothetical protein
MARRGNLRLLFAILALLIVFSPVAAEPKPREQAARNVPALEVPDQMVPDAAVVRLMRPSSPVPSAGEDTHRTEFDRTFWVTVASNWLLFILLGGLLYGEKRLGSNEKLSEAFRRRRNRP